MVIDSSAVLAVLFNEPERADFVAAIAQAPRRSVSAASPGPGDDVLSGTALDAASAPKSRAIAIQPSGRTRPEHGILHFDRLSPIM